MLTVNIDGIENKFKPAISNSIKYLGLAEDSLSSIIIPSDFTYRSRLRTLSQNISNIDTRVTNIKNWVDRSISNFNNVERSNKNVVNNLISAIPASLMNSNISKTGAKTAKVKKETKDKEGFFEKAFKAVSGAVDYVISGEFITDTFEIAEKTASKVVKEVKSTVSLIVSTGAEVKNNVKSFISDKVKPAMQKVGGVISSAWEFTYQNIIEPSWDFIKSVTASTVNILAGLIKGLSQLVESLLDFVVMLCTGVGSIFTGLADGITYLGALITGDTENWSSITGDMWKGVMGYVAEDHVGNAFSDFYENTIVGQWLDNNAYEWFKSDGIGTNIAAGIGYIAGIVVLTIATCGIGTAATGATLSTTVVSSTIAASAGTGKYTQEAWANMRDSSWEGMERLFEKGEITEEQYNSFVMIRELSDEQWASIVNDYDSGKISKEEFELMSQIREMPEDWTTLENGLKGLGYGITNGVWEGIQFYVGGKLGSLIGKGGAALRVGIDTGFNSLDTPFRVATEALFTDSTLEQAWIEQGGWNSVLTNTIIGLIGSAGGEVFNGLTSSKIKTDTINGVGLNQKINELDDFFETIRGMNGEYGTDQGLLTNLRTKNPQKYAEIKDLLVSEYKFSAKDADRFLDVVDSVGACVYARGVNSIIDFYKEFPDLFEEDFGYSLYKQDANGEMVLNDAQLLIDYYYWGNLISEEAELFRLTPDGQTVFNEDAFFVNSEGGTGVKQRGSSWQDLTNFIQSKSKNVSLESVSILSKNGAKCDFTIDEIRRELTSQMNKGNKLSIGGVGLKFTDLETSIPYHVDSAHWVKITGVEDTGFTVSSWGKKMFVKYEDLLADDAVYMFISDSYKLSSQATGASAKIGIDNEASIFKKFKTRKTLTMPEKIEISRNIMSDYFKNNPNLGISEEKLNDVFKTIIACENDDAFMNIAHQLSNWTDEELSYIMAFRSDYNGGVIILRPDNSIDQIIHEANHSLGDSRYPSGNVLKESTNPRGMNEALTERLALKIQGKDGVGDSGYYRNVSHLNRIIDILEKAGYHDIDSISYYTYNPEYLANAINEIFGHEEFYDELVEKMNIADGFGDVTDDIKIEQANILINEYIDFLERKIGG